MRAISIALGLWLPVACGAAEGDDTRQTHAGGGATGIGAGGGAGGSLTIDAGGGGIGLIGSGGLITDAPSDPLVVQDAGWFQCGSCLCDGATAYCRHVTAGPPLYPTPPPPDAALCPQDGGFSDCMALPAACNGVPSCACVGMPQPHCTCVDAGGGIFVNCSLP